ncbi:MAG: carnitine dehydratase [Proteobacteria bacterium]|nr:MAG: carnitine dehydratase [Pseudomonadota bacterium]
MADASSGANAAAPRCAGPLADVVVVDLTRVLAGPFATLLLADLGARVIKVERPGIGDDARHVGPFLDGRSAYFLSLNRGKESIALDLRDDADRAVFERLLARADVLVENYRPGVLARLGYGWDALHARFPRLVLASVSGFGQSGPLAARPAYDLVVQAMGGIMSITGHEGGPPTRVGTSIGDLGAALFTALGVVGALRHRDRTGEATPVDVAMLDCQVALLENAIARFAATGESPRPLGSRHPSIAPFEAYPTADGHIAVAVGNDALFARFAETIGAPGLAADARFASNALRCEHVEALRDVLSAQLRSAPSAAWLARLEAAGIPCGPIQNVAEVLAHPQVRARNMVVTVPDPTLGAFPVAGNPIKSPAFADPATRPPAPALGADRARILAWLDAEDDR